MKCSITFKVKPRFYGDLGFVSKLEPELSLKDVPIRIIEFTLKNNPETMKKQIQDPNLPKPRSKSLVRA